MLPFPSSAVNTTFVVPTVITAPASGNCVTVTPPQLFAVKAEVKSGTIASQSASTLKVTGDGQSKIGATLSSTVTVAIHVLVFPASSVTVNST